VVAHVNSYTGLSYGDEPAVMSWELANEPRGFHNNEAAFNVWIDEAAAFIKSLDPVHLVTTGCEGDTPWPDWNGLDFVANHDGADIDYTTIHIWPQNWGWYDPAAPEATFPGAEANARSYFGSHAAMCAALDKPLVLEEFGLARDGGSYDPAATTTWRDLFLAAMYEEVHGSASGGGPAGGDDFWAWAGEGRPLEPYGSYWSPGDPWIGDPPHEHQGWYSVYDGDETTLAVITAHAAALIDLIPPTAVDEPAADAGRERGELRVLPSPSIGTAAIRCTLPEGRHRGALEIIDINGRKIAEYEICETLDLIRWPRGVGERIAASSGTYLARLSWEDGERSVKFVYLR